MGILKEDGGQGGVSSQVHEQQLYQFFMSHETSQETNSVFDLGHVFGALCTAINSLGEPAVGGPECTEL